MGREIGAGVYFFQLLVDLLRCNSAWGSLWDTLAMRAWIARVEVTFISDKTTSLVYT